jgi:alpha-ketoglutarate-dependent taurine dioxygenase
MVSRIAPALTITPLHPHFGARVEGVDLAAALDEPTFRRVFDAFQEHSVPFWSGIVP